ncbi:SMC-Scp complex subunit ScpB [Ezakiella coagulans]|uniref:SMC-Scp complex subunit ScpB n=1 Tax=Ezakiella coagulans TaxID=46507 RepID=UPI002014A78D|nr:SMC-Scp complex subunit ScpB [Ezakiella coagulans]UQK60835.1 SMC-Scp complex subunit ScpB [Ezakiella coagulans]
MDDLYLKNSIEALIFAWGDSIEVKEIANFFEVEISKVKKIIEELKTDYSERGIRLQVAGGLVTFSTNPEYGESIKSFGIQVLKKNITEANMETLSVIAYLGPTTKAVVDNVRGVNSDGSIQNLLKNELIYEVGRLKAPGKPFVYKVTDKFLMTFNIDSLDDLPPLMDRDEIKEKLKFTEIKDEDIDFIMDTEEVE